MGRVLVVDSTGPSFYYSKISQNLNYNGSFFQIYFVESSSTFSMDNFLDRIVAHLHKIDNRELFEHGYSKKNFDCN